MDLDLKQIETAAKRLAPIIHKTQIELSTTFSSMTGGEIYLKYENQQKTGSFKIRGASNKIAALVERDEIKSAVAEKFADRNKVAEAVSELLAFVSGNDKSAENDIRIGHEDGSYVIMLCNNGAEIDESKFVGKYKSFEHSVVLGMNQIKEII